MIDVEYLRHCGDDLAVVNAARVSFHAESDWVGVCDCETEYECDGHCAVTPEVELCAKDAGLIDYLARHKHKSPFNHAFASFRVKAPIFVARQLVKHEYMPWNEVSRRYVEGDLEWYWPEYDDWRSQPKNVKQGSGEPLQLIDRSIITDNYRRLISVAEDVYYDAIARGLSREQARMFLPQSLMTEWVWSGSVYAFAKMCQLRLDSHAQKESQYVAEKIDATMAALFPVCWEALKKHGAN